ncbi:MAG: phage integrase SAM-like domain-containing protein [Bacteroidetes bacterium]|nr:phage integrase SAM-like domain-containing protein [Bacteroidota bacterium]
MSRIYKRGNTWYTDFEYKGKRLRKSLGTRSKHVAELRLKDIDGKIAREKFDFAPLEKITFGDFVDKFLDWYEVQNSAKSYQDYRSLFTSTIIPYFGQTTLTDLTVETIEKYKGVRAEQVSPSSVNKELVALRHLLNKAILWSYLNQNPAKQVEKLRVKEKRFRFLKLEEINAVLDACPAHAKSIFLTACILE